MTSGSRSKFLKCPQFLSQKDWFSYKSRFFLCGLFHRKVDAQLVALRNAQSQKGISPRFCPFIHRLPLFCSTLVGKKKRGQASPSFPRISHSALVVGGKAGERIKRGAFQHCIYALHVHFLVLFQVSHWFALFDVCPNASKVGLQ